MSLIEAVKDAKKKRIALGHFNISTFAALNGILKAAKELDLPVVIGVSEGEAKYMMGVRVVGAVIKILKEESGQQIFLNSDHTHSLENSLEAARAGFDSILFDGSKYSLEENIARTKEVVEAVKSVNPQILVEGEIGNIGTASEIREGVPEGAAIKEKDLTKPEDALRFVKETGVDLFGPAVGNIHGMMADRPDPSLNIQRIREISEAIKIPLVLHGGSGNVDSDFVKAIEAGIRIIHINTEIRLAWRNALEESFKARPNEVVPYKLLDSSAEAVYQVVLKKLKLFSGGDSM